MKADDPEGRGRTFHFTGERVEERVIPVQHRREQRQHERAIERGPAGFPPVGYSHRGRESMHGPLHCCEVNLDSPPVQHRHRLLARKGWRAGINACRRSGRAQGGDGLPHGRKQRPPLRVSGLEPG